jgi:hypothetical protein
MQSEDLLLYSQECAIRPYSEVNPGHTLPSTSRSSLVTSFQDSNQNFVCTSHLSNVCYAQHLSHIPWFEHTNICGEYRLIDHIE